MLVRIGLPTSPWLRSFNVGTSAVLHASGADGATHSGHAGRYLGATSVPLLVVATAGTVLAQSAALGFTCQPPVGT
jgi:hypothetical protein